MGGTSSRQRSISEFTFVEALFAIIIAWTLVSLWVRFIDNLAYRTLKLNPVSAFHALVVALTVTAIFIIFTYSAESTVSNIIIGTTETTPDTSTQQQPSLLMRNTANKLSIGNMIHTESGRVIMPGPLLDIQSLKQKSYQHQQVTDKDMQIINNIVNKGTLTPDYTRQTTGHEYRRQPRYQTPPTRDVSSLGI